MIAEHFLVGGRHLFDVDLVILHFPHLVADKGVVAGGSVEKRHVDVGRQNLLVGTVGHVDEAVRQLQEGVRIVGGVPAARRCLRFPWDSKSSGLRSRCEVRADPPRDRDWPGAAFAVRDAGPNS